MKGLHTVCQIFDIRRCLVVDGQSVKWIIDQMMFAVHLGGLTLDPGENPTSTVKTFVCEIVGKSPSMGYFRADELTNEQARESKATYGLSISIEHPTMVAPSWIARLCRKGCCIVLPWYCPLGLRP